MLCKDLHKKGKVERLIRFVKENFLAGRVFGTITELNLEALGWCNRQNGVYHRAVDCIPYEKHQADCMHVASVLTKTQTLAFYLCLERKIFFDGFVHYEGRHFGVPYWYTQKTCRIRRDSFTLYHYPSDLRKVLHTTDAHWK